MCIACVYVHVKTHDHDDMIGASIYHQAIVKLTQESRVLLFCLIYLGLIYTLIYTFQYLISNHNVIELSPPNVFLKY